MQEQDKWNKEHDESREFRLTDTMADIEGREAEDARVHRELSGEYSKEDIASITGAGNKDQDEF